VRARAPVCVCVRACVRACVRESACAHDAWTRLKRAHPGWGEGLHVRAACIAVHLAHVRISRSLSLSLVCARTVCAPILPCVRIAYVRTLYVHYLHARLGLGGPGPSRYESHVPPTATGGAQAPGRDPARKVPGHGLGTDVIVLRPPPRLGLPAASESESLPGPTWPGPRPEPGNSGTWSLSLRLTWTG
jgi:hypothetical protein